MKSPNYFRPISMGITGLWLSFFIALPFVLVLLNSVAITEDRGGVPFTFTLTHYQQIISPIYLRIFLRSLGLSLAVAFLCLLIGYPFAYWLSQVQSPRLKSLLLLLTIIPFWTSTLVRTYAIMTLIRAKGLINHCLMTWGIIHHPLPILYTKAAVVIGLTYNLLPFMILPIFANLDNLDRSYVEAGKDLGARPHQVLTKILLPLTSGGIGSGGLLVTLSCLTLFYVPDILGGAKSLLLGNVITNHFLAFNNWPMGSAIGMSLTFSLGIVFLIYRWGFNKPQPSLVPNPVVH